MIFILREEPDPPYTEPRGTCPDCGSDEVIHHVFGVADPRTEPPAPSWVEWYSTPPFIADRSCVECDAYWYVGRLEPPLSPMRLISADGAAFTLLLVPDLQEYEGVEIDIELLTPDRLVRYLNRAPEDGALQRLGDFLMQAAEAGHPELAAPSYQDAESGLSVRMIDSGPLSVTVEVQVIIELDGDGSEVDGIAFDVLRADLITAAHQIWEWEA